MRTAAVITFVCVISPLINYAIIRLTESLFGWNWAKNPLWHTRTGNPGKSSQAHQKYHLKSLLHTAADLAIRGFSAFVSFGAAIVMFLWVWTNWVQ
ncbi:MAG: hypothetical protein KGY42_04430 [Desulfobacterales bacterium]|nr:hypothetical protein [Desulfobacterales bacterium]MBS3755974.1 hypothetical protein [Desulfobacterales bacterium]